MILAVPVTVIIKIICENIDELKGIAIILGNSPNLSEDKDDKKETNSEKESSTPSTKKSENETNEIDKD